MSESEFMNEFFNDIKEGFNKMETPKPPFTERAIELTEKLEIANETINKLNAELKTEMSHRVRLKIQYELLSELYNELLDKVVS